MNSCDARELGRTIVREQTHANALRDVHAAAGEGIRRSRAHFPVGALRHQRIERARALFGHRVGATWAVDRDHVSVIGELRGGFAASPYARVIDGVLEERETRDAVLDAFLDRKSTRLNSS